MAAGAWVFPIGIIAFVGFLAAFLMANPAEPAAFLVVKAGDTITYEETAFYGDGFVAWTTREDLIQSGSVRVGPYGIVPKPREITVTLASNASNVTDPNQQFLLGKHANETVRTEPQENYFGAWERNATIDRTVGTLPVVVTLRTGQPVGGQSFNATAYAKGHEQQFGQPLRVGDNVTCDFGTCRIVSFDATQVTFRHFIQDGATVPADRLIFFPDQAAKPRSRFLLRTVGSDQFAVVWDPVDGDTFTLLNGFAGLPAGYYHFVSHTDTALSLQYRGTESFTSDRQLVPAHLIGERVWFEFVVTRIQ